MAEALTPAPGVTGTIELVATGRSGGDERMSVRVVDGRPVGTGAGAQPDLTLSMAAAELPRLLDGSVEPSVAFMRGRLKTAGDNGLLLGVLAATADPGFASWLAGIGTG